MNHVVAMDSQKALEVSSLIGFDYEVDKPCITRGSTGHYIDEPWSLGLKNDGQFPDWKTVQYIEHSTNVHPRRYQRLRR